jgi:hypothetical protein
MVFPKKDLKQKTFVGSAKKVDEEVNNFCKGVESIGRIINVTAKRELLRDDEIIIVCTIIYQEK